MGALAWGLAGHQLGSWELFSVASLVSGFIFLSWLSFSSLPYNFLEIILFNYETFFLHPQICFLFLPFQFFPHPTGGGSEWLFAAQLLAGVKP